MKDSEIRVTAAKIYLKAADYITQYGWQKSGMGVDGEPRCSVGALASAYPKQKWNRDLATTMYKALYKELNGMTLTQFNYKFNDGSKVANLYERVARSLV